MRVGAGSSVRAELEDKPRGPFSVDPGAALDALELEFGDLCTLGHDGRWFRAHRDGSEETVIAATPDELVRGMQDRWGGAR
jgi:hypothetical protein